MVKKIIGYVRENQRKHQCGEIEMNTTDGSGLHFLNKLLLGVRLVRSVELRNGFLEKLGGSRK